MADDAAQDDTGASDTRLPGVSLAEYTAAVEVLQSLRDEGRYTIMVTGMPSVRLIGSVQEFRQSFLDKFEGTGDMDTEPVLSEVRNFCQVAVLLRPLDAAQHFIEANIYDDEIKELEGDEQERFRGEIRQKLELAKGLVPQAAKQRQRRLRTATEPCLEDVDVELVHERQDDLQGLKVDQPFLRLRFRYTDGTENYFRMFRMPWGQYGDTSCKSFSLEVDEVDIDVLLFRLREAKTLLSSAVKTSTSE